ncbi:hypothetical protein B566_EDAN009913 [Ephemera danica]|nr:hypothetical protein B566_EDAN009913 [Ephemera danica]
MGNLNVYLTQWEVRRLFGLHSSELYYVREGVVNQYALNFVVPVPAQISDLHFTWQALGSRPLPYTMSVDVSDTAALSPPQLNVSLSGGVPTKPQTFRVVLPCSGLADAEVDVRILINITTQRGHNATTLTFRRRKICLKDASPPPDLAVSVQAPELTRSETDTDGAMYAALGSAYTMPTAPPLPNKYTAAGSSSAKSASSYASFSSRRQPAPRLHGSAHSVLNSAQQEDERTHDPHERIAELTIQRCRVRLRSVLMEGTFGRVYLGSYADANNAAEEEVLVKTVAEHASQGQVSLLLQEGMSMYALCHPNVLAVRGVSIEDHTAPFLIYPHTGYTNLKRFLVQCRSSGSDGVALTTQQLVDMALQVTTGLQYLHHKHILHRDLAARNCVVDSSLHMRIADNALSRDVFPADYHCLGDNENRPVKWLALEALTQHNFSFASEVWAFGVLLWELTTLAQQPYAEVDPFEMADYLRDGYRLAQPVNCPDELFAVMAYCWSTTPEERPSLQQLNVCLQGLYSQLTRYV